MTLYCDRWCLNGRLPTQAALYAGGHHLLIESGRRIPQDVSLVCTDPDPGFIWCNPSVAHIRWVDNIARGKDDRRQSYTKAEFVEGGTVGKAP